MWMVTVSLVSSGLSYDEDDPRPKSSTPPSSFALMTTVARTRLGSGREGQDPVGIDGRGNGELVGRWGHDLERDVLVALVGWPGRDVRRPLDRDRPVADLGLDQGRAGREGGRVVDRRDPQPVARLVGVRLAVERPIGDDVRDPVALGRAVVGIRAVLEPVVRRPRDHLCLAVRRLPDEIDRQRVTVGVGVVDQGRARRGPRYDQSCESSGMGYEPPKASGGCTHAGRVVDRDGRRFSSRSRARRRPRAAGTAMSPQ